MRSLWQPVAEGPSRPPESDDLARSVSSDVEAVPLREAGVPAFPPAVSAGRRRRLGAAAWRIRARRDRAGGCAALSAAAQYPADPRGVAETRTAGGPTDRDRS